MINAVAAANGYRASLAFARFIPASGPSSGGGSGAVRATVALLRTILTADGPIINQVTVQGNLTAGDGYGGVYTWFAGDTSADDGNSVIRPNDYTTGGVWKKLV